MSPPPTQHAQLQELAYNALNHYFRAHPDLTPEIEVLPPAFEPTDALILEDGANLGVPKKILALAFVHARRLFFAHHKLDGFTAQTTTHDATRVMLLFDPEHLTAANSRKRYLLDLQREDTVVEALHAERRFLDSILTSPLHRQSKSPTLWAHRAWWSDMLISRLSCSDWGIFFTTELDAAIKSGERHPKNYYAWQYARRVVEKSGEWLSGEEFEDFISECAAKVSRWCMRHVGDISGFSFLMYVLGRVSAPDERARVVEEIVTYGLNVQLANESLWTFVRMALASGLIEEAMKNNMLRELGKCGEEQNGESRLFSARLSETLYWIAENEVVNDSPRMEDGIWDFK
ncbi:hypothetical protein PMIN04_000985 [Paraphaeosphaeria minitans]